MRLRRSVGQQVSSSHAQPDISDAHEGLKRAIQKAFQGAVCLVKPRLRFGGGTGNPYQTMTFGGRRVLT